MLSITKIFEFSASHYLCNKSISEADNAALFGPCANVHGHNYKLEVTITGALSSSEKMIMNTARLKQLVNESIINDLDHSCLNEVAWLKDNLPTAEVLICTIWDRLDKAIIQVKSDVRLTRLRLWETNTIYAELEK